MAKCAECGFLATRGRDNLELYEAKQPFREAGIYHDNRWRFLGDEPVCSVIAHTLQDEVMRDGHVQNDRVLSALRKERECSSSSDRQGFTPWKPGFTPKEHQEMLDRKWLLERQERLEREQRGREDKRDAEQRSWQSSEKARSERWNLVNFLVASAGVLAVLFTWVFVSPPSVTNVIQAPVTETPTPIPARTESPAKPPTEEPVQP